ncbi:MAG TPA: hypothetical protein VN805_10945 [Caulobacteraceae bacterium]|nr:hypothetical protein [Caulobacteraceae bacterium]
MRRGDKQTRPGRGANSRVAKPRAARAPQPAPPTGKPLFVFLTEPGVADLALAELKHLKLVQRRARPLRLNLRSHDMLVLPASLVDVARGRSRLCTNMLAAPIFGRGAITPRQLDHLAAVFRTGGYRRLVSSVAGAAFDRPELMRWLARELGRRGVVLAEAGRAIRLLVVDEAFYFGEERQNHHDAPGRATSATRSAALPPTIAAAMAFAAKLGADETVWDPTAGTGNVLAEVLALAPDAALVVTDVDAAALGELERRLPAATKPWTRVADAATVELPTRTLSLTIANLPFGRRYVAEGGNPAFYAAVLANSLKHAGAGWRGVFLTSDAAALRDAARRAGLTTTVVADIKVRGLAATIWRVERPDRT